MMFQSAPSRGGRCESTLRAIRHHGFNPRPRVEGDARDLGLVMATEVSIRALAWRAIQAAQKLSLCITFQSAPSRGGRCNGRPLTSMPACFNPRPRVEGDSGDATCSRPVRSVSIRALAWRAIEWRNGNYPSKAVSIRALAWRAMPRLAPASASFVSFNPRPRVEGDAVIQRAWGMKRVSIRALAWRAIPDPTTILADTEFQSAPSRGGRYAIRPRPTRALQFQSAPSRGGRSAAYSNAQIRKKFQSAPSRGGRFA